MPTIEIDGVKIDNVIVDHGVLCKIGKRIRLSHANLDENLRSVQSKVLKKCMLIILALYRANWTPSTVQRPVLVEFIQKYLECSEKTAYDYANALIWINSFGC